VQTAGQFLPTLRCDGRSSGLGCALPFVARSLSLRAHCRPATPIAGNRQVLAVRSSQDAAPRLRSKLARPLLNIPRAPPGAAGGMVHMAGDSLFGVHGNALEVRAQRMGVLAGNIANASTPGFKARDVDWKSALASATATGNVDAGITAQTKYRVPSQPSMDGNTVELASEQTAFAENAVQYQTTLSFLNGRIGQITRALKGE